MTRSQALLVAVQPTVTPLPRVAGPPAPTPEQQGASGPETGVVYRWLGSGHLEGDSGNAASTSNATQERGHREGSWHWRDTRSRPGVSPCTPGLSEHSLSAPDTPSHRASWHLEVRPANPFCAYVVGFAPTSLRDGAGRHFPQTWSRLLSGGRTRPNSLPPRTPQVTGFPAAWNTGPGRDTHGYLQGGLGFPPVPSQDVILNSTEELGLPRVATASGLAPPKGS